MKRLFFMMVLLTAAVGVARAETIHQQFGESGGTVDMFDPALGTLDKVTMQLATTPWEGQASVINDVGGFGLDSGNK